MTALPDTPIPFTLTPKAHALLSTATPAAALGPGEWGCDQCGAAFFGTPPGDGLCPPCQGGTGEP
jgi:hypothetical protein